ncbi:Gfo/Idh/MocA family protein [Streptomyces sp. NPDC051561]|uniref:Gfo/Idh/MocA family protein n=1 Tax=Streptomyces sp. NPDC051561 TaxID=3365658 RepID=UPI0037A36217
MTAGPVRVGVLGCAAIARRRMIPAFAACDQVELVAVASRDGARAAELAGQYGCRGVEGYEALLADDGIEAVYVPLPAALHARWTEAALRAGKHVLAEKPLTLDPVTTAALMRLAAERGLALRENVMFVHHSQHEAVGKLVADGAIGELRSLRAEFSIPRQSAGDIRYDETLGGGALWDTGVYPVRAALHFLGPELEVAGAALVRGAGERVDTSGAVLLRTRRGVLAQLAFGLDHGYRNTYELCGSEGRITVDRAFTPPEDFRPVLRLERHSEPSEVTLPADPQMANTVADFVAAVRGGAAPDGRLLEQAELLDAIRRYADDAQARN